MWIFQAPMDALRRWKWRWFSTFMGIIQNEIIWPAMVALGEAGKNYAITLMKEAANETSLDGPAKFEFVFKAMRKRYTVDAIKDDALRNVLANIFSYVKNTS